MSPMKILMVCLGNICRSPLAEGILKEKIKTRGLDAEVDSAGTAAYHVGEKPDRRSIEIAEKHGIDITYQSARQFEMADFKRFDKIYAMDRHNYDDLVSMARDPLERQKVEMILNMAHPKQNLNVPDPYYGGKDGFINVYNMLDQATEVIAGMVEEKTKKR